MVKEVDVEIWAKDAWDVFLNVATAAWELLEVRPKLWMEQGE
jgi:hypothetical protein